MLHMNACLRKGGKPHKIKSCSKEIDGLQNVIQSTKVAEWENASLNSQRGKKQFSILTVPSSASLNRTETSGSLDSCMSCTMHSWIGSLFLSNQPLMLYWTCVKMTEKHYRML